jgi:hypothetical protein
MIAVYLGLGLLFFFTEIAIDTFPSYRKELGVTMLVYSTIRSGLMIRKHRKNREDEF